MRVARGRADVRDGAIRVDFGLSADVGFAPLSDQPADMPVRRLGAMSDLLHRSASRLYSITSSAPAEASVARAFIGTKL
jgi:hypothetical protein